jgi:HlyD family secretion protein
MTAFDTNDNPEKKPSLESVASPERLDQLMRVIKPKDFIPVATMGGLTLTALIWSVVGRIPITVNGSGVLISPQPVMELQSPVAGQLKSLLIKDNQCVEKGEVLATIQPIELEEQLKQQQIKHQQLLAQAANVTTVQQEKTQVEENAIAATRNSLNQRLRDVQAFSPVIKEQTLANIEQQRQTLQQRLQDKSALVSITKERELNTIREQRQTMQQRLQDFKDLEPVLKKRLAVRKQLLSQGGIAADIVLEAENNYRDNRNQLSSIQATLTELKSKEIEIEKSFRENRYSISEIQTQLQQLDSQKITTEKSFQENRTSVSEIQAQLGDLNTRSKQLEQDNLQAANTRKNEVAEVESAIAQTQQQITERSQIRSPQSGCILEVSTTLGQVVEPGTRVGTLQPQGTGASQISSIAYFDVKDGKRIKPGMKMQITPDTVKRERFGGIVATVKSVSPYPVTSTTVTSKVGNTELAETLTNKTAKVEIVASLELEPNNTSGYQWSSSKGPDMKLTPGTTMAVRVKVEEQAPITFLLPFLREWSGIQ